MSELVLIVDVGERFCMSCDRLTYQVRKMFGFRCLQCGVEEHVEPSEHPWEDRLRERFRPEE